MFAEAFGKKTFVTLQEVMLSEEEAQQLYAEVVMLMRRMYRDCKLVHADLSEYNMLYRDGRVSEAHTPSPQKAH